MKRFLVLFFSTFLAGLALLWGWGLSHRMDFLSRDYALWMGKKGLMESADRPWTAYLGDSMVLNDVMPKALGPGVVNLGLNGGTAIEGYFLVRRK